MSFFFFKQKTAYEMRISDWSSDVCSSDLPEAMVAMRRARLAVPGPEIAARDRSAGPPRRLDPVLDHRVEAVAPGRRRAGGIGLAVAGEAELLDHPRLAKRFGAASVGVDRESVGAGKGGAVRVDPGGARRLKKKK